MSADQTLNASGAWSNYWRKGFQTTFVGGESDYYSGETRTHWLEVFNNIAGGSSILDLGSGNGALLEIATSVEGYSQRPFQLIALDYADISESGFFLDHPEIRVQSNTSIEATSLKAESIDLAISQFGYEYSSTAEAAEELVRILKPGGQFRAVLHHADSSISLHSNSAVQQIAWCQRSNLAQTSISLLRRLNKLRKSHRDPQKDTKASELREFFNQMAARLNQYGDQLPDASHIGYFLNELGSLFHPEKAKGLNLEQKIGIVEQLEIDSQEYEQRMQSMLNASSDQVAIERIRDELINAGLRVEEPELLGSENQKIAWILKADK